MSHSELVNFSTQTCQISIVKVKKKKKKEKKSFVRAFLHFFCTATAVESCWYCSWEVKLGSTTWPALGVLHTFFTTSTTLRQQAETRGHPSINSSRVADLNTSTFLWKNSIFAKEGQSFSSQVFKYNILQDAVNRTRDATQPGVLPMSYVHTWSRVPESPWTPCRCPPEMTASPEWNSYET